ncbi:prolyl oligopeptidase family serine peptidase [Photobacterium ganghwense]|uniref:prolyl oligopeptidase family serine peptidase n=1 Tax=Photobacterium ganghwense TaxID=320778 RepID=UPI0039F00ABF
MTDMNKKVLAATAAALAVTAGAAQAVESTDPFLWLEDVEGKQALEWVKAQNDQTIDYLKKVPSYNEFYQDSLTILNSQDRLAYPTRRGNYYYNFWQDGTHVKGVYRRTSPESYRKADPEWETVIDVDALAKAENQDWVFKGLDCYAPDYKRCMVALSRGGADATVQREFDLDTKQFVTGGFELPEAKSGVTWLDENHLLVGSDFGEGSLTDSGYPRVLKLWKRDTPLSEAKTLYEGEQSSVSVGAYTLRDKHQRITLVREGLTFYTNKTFLLENGTLKPLSLPEDSDIGGYFNGDLFIQLKTDLQQQGQVLKQGSIIYAPVAALVKGNPVFQVLATPTEHASIEWLNFTANHVVVSWLKDVVSQVEVFSLTPEKTWQSKVIEIEDNGSLSVFNTSAEHDDFFVDFSGFLTPPSIYQVDAVTHKVTALKSTPAKFDTRDMLVEQHFAISTDGTKVPYFVVRKKSLALNGKNPTLLYGYGGFEVSLNPYYSALTGKNWLEKGGVYVLANIRGGGEYGPGWHLAALKQNRHKAYEDFEAVAEDLIARKITSSAHLGIQGGSNGGLLVGAAVTRRPALYNAVVCQVPLLDMKRFNKLLAGASWMAEYGNPDIDNEWEYIRTYSPYHNVKKDVSYPKVFFTTSTRDDRVHPAHARKMVALMQSQGHDVIYFENMEGGHAGASNNNSRADMYAQIYSYLADRLM